jgi:hypothetical protein
MLASLPKVVGAQDTCFSRCACSASTPVSWCFIPTCVNTTETLLLLLRRWSATDLKRTGEMCGWWYVRTFDCFHYIDIFYASSVTINNL